MSPDILHKHLIIRAEVEEPFTNNIMVDFWMLDLVKKLSMKKLLGPFSVYCDKEGNEGITSIMAIETSHIALHIWDKCCPAILQLDVYTCSELDENIVFDHLQIMKPSKIEWKYIDRNHELKLVGKGIFELR